MIRIPDGTSFEQAGNILAEALLNTPPESIPAVIGWLGRLTALAQLRLVSGGQVEISPVTSSEAGKYLSVQEVSERFHVTPRWLYRHKKQMPHSQPSQKVLLFPEQSITRWFASRKGT